MLLSVAGLRALEEQQAARRALNRAMIAASQGPKCRAGRAYAAAAAAQRSTLMLDALPDELPLVGWPVGDALALVDAAPRKGRPRREAPLGQTTQRCLDLLVQGARPREVQEVVGLSRNTCDYLLREALGALGARQRSDMLELWRARALETGHQPREGDLRALEGVRARPS